MKHKQPHVLKLFSCGEISLQAKPSDLPPRRGRFPLSLMVDDPSKAFLDTNNCLPSKNDKWGGHLKWWGTHICFVRGETALPSERPRSGVSATLPARPPGRHQGAQTTCSIEVFLCHCLRWCPCNTPVQNFAQNLAGTCPCGLLCRSLAKSEKSRASSERQWQRSAAINLQSLDQPAL